MALSTNLSTSSRFLLQHSKFSHRGRLCQSTGIWAWDCIEKERVLVIPSVLAILGDNPMQSEFACHIGFRGKFFCRACWVKGEGADVVDEDNVNDGATDDGHESDASSSRAPRKKRSKANETMEEMISRVKAFVTVSPLTSHHCLSALMIYTKLGWTPSGERGIDAKTEGTVFCSKPRWRNG